MKETAIQFEPEMVRALVDGRKSQTRVPVRSEHDACPYGKSGDRLFVVQGSYPDKVSSFEQRFWKRVYKFDSCWEWFGRTNWKKYGEIKRDGKMIRTHRASWELHNGAIPDNLHVLHKCDLRWCVNPNHLSLGTNQDNVADKMAKGRCRLPSGENHVHAKLTYSQVAEMKFLYRAGGIYQKDLARRFGVTQEHVCKIINGRAWATREDVPIQGHRTLEISDIHMQKLQELGEDGVTAQGIPVSFDHRKEFANFWNSIHLKDGYEWSTNPFVFVLTFHMI